MSRFGVARQADQRFFGVVVALVTDNDDPEKLGRVKLSYPWFSGSMVSEWARVAQPYAGGGYGFYWMPETDDEVLVAFMHGDMRTPIVIGGLFNGVDKPPFARNGGDPKYIQTKAGHRVLFQDKAGEQKVEIIDATGKNSFVIECSDNSISITAQGDINIKSSKQLNLSGTSGVVIKSDGSVKVNGKTIELN